MTLAFQFPGQGSQSPGMLTDLAAAYPLVRERFEAAGDLIGEDLWNLVREGPESALSATAVTQPALLTASVALFEVWTGCGGPRPDIMAGHSLGEYSALVCAGALAFEDAVMLVRRRGDLMQQAVPRGEGSMAAILGLDEALTAEVCAAVAGVVAPANLNAPGQTVIAGAADAVAEAVAACRERGARRALLLDVSGPFHSPLMAPVRETFGPVLASVTIRPPEIPVVQNVDATVASDPAAIRQRLLDQLAAPVQWTSCVLKMAQAGAERLLEFGPGKVLTGLARRIDRRLQAGSVGDLTAFREALAAQG